MRPLFTLLFLFSSIITSAQEKAYQKNEFLKYRVHYGLANAGYASFAINEKAEDSSYHFIAKGWTVGMASWFFKVRDNYESYVDKEKQLPTHFVRNLSEGGYKINRDLYFDIENQKVTVKDHKRNTTTEHNAEEVQDIISAFYYLRNQDIDSLKIGESVAIDLFLDFEVFPFKLVLLNKEPLSTKFGKIMCYKMRPMVQTGRIFKEKESLTFWISADKNKIPLMIKADLLVGSLKIDLTSYSGLSYAFPEK